jgi:hypothetical protein
MTQSSAILMIPPFVCFLLEKIDNMAQIDGSYDCITKTAMGDQKSVLTIATSGDTFTGTNAGMLGTLVLNNGRVDGNSLTWSVDMKVPLAMTLKCEAVVDGDTLTGTVDGGAFGKMAMTGKRMG